MMWRARLALIGLVSAGGLGCGLLVGATAPPPRPPTPEERAIAYLAVEVPRWASANHCYSCHNNGDAARALYLAQRRGYAVPPGALEDTSRWLVVPARWDANGGPEFSDKGLARIQFAAVLTEALNANLIRDRRALQKAAELVAEGQQADGSWQLDSGGTVGSPATYGNCLATVQARRVLHIADAKKHQEAIARADKWLREARPTSVLDAAALLLASTPDAEQRERCLGLIRAGQNDDGGWGPYVNSAPEAFDTALVLLALGRPMDEETKRLATRGRAYLVATQQADGSWPETTRPAGAESYAQRLSTTGWAAQALLKTRSAQ